MSDLYVVQERHLLETRTSLSEVVLEHKLTLIPSNTGTAWTSLQIQVFNLDTRLSIISGNFEKAKLSLEELKKLVESVTSFTQYLCHA